MYAYFFYQISRRSETMSDRCQIECQLAGITRRQIIFIYQTNEQHINIQFDTVLLRHFYAVTNIMQNMLKPFINGTWEDLAIFYYFDTMLRPETPYAGSARCPPFSCRLAICGSPDPVCRNIYWCLHILIMIVYRLNARVKCRIL